MKMVLAVLSALVLSACVPSTNQDASRGSSPATNTVESSLTKDELVEQLNRGVRDRVVRVRTELCSGLGTGSGFFISPRAVVTNKHVIDGYRAAEVTTWAGTNIAVTGVQVTPNSDLAILTVRTPQRDIFSEVDPLVFGQTVAVVGYPLGGVYTTTLGRVIDQVPGYDYELGSGNDVSVYRISNEVLPGNSGGPLVNMDGNVLAVVFAIEIATGYGLAIDIDDLEVLSLSGAMVNLSPDC